MISFVKDTLVYVVIGVAIFYIPHRLGGWNHIFNSYDAHFKATPPGTASLLTSANTLQYITLAVGSAFAIFLYPHAITGVITTRNRAVVKRTMAGLPIYSFVLGLIALFGVMAIAGGIKPLIGPTGKPDTNTVVPNLFQHMFPSGFAGLAFAMIVIGALVRRPSCRSRRPTCLPATSTRNTCGGMPTNASRPSSASTSRCW